jgi:hypothetical protein
MPCKLQIKENVEKFVDKNSQRGLSMSLQDANILASNINAKMKNHVVSFYNDGGKIGRIINIPNELVDMYFDIEVKRRTPVTTDINIPVKEGVQKIFDSNPELADQVYEALGFKTKTSENKITRAIKEELPYKVIGNYNEIDEGLIGRKVYEEKIGNDMYKFEISNYSYPNEDGSSESFYDIDFTVNGSEEEIGSGFFDKSEKGKQIVQALLSQNFGNNTVRFNVDESKKGKQRLMLYKRLMNQLGYSPSSEMEYALFYNIKTDKVNVTPQQKQQALQLYSQYLDTIFPNSNEKDIFYHGVPFIENKDDFFRDSEDDGSILRDNEVNIRLWNYFFKNRDRASDYGDQQYAVVLDFSADFDSKELAYKASPTFLTNDSAIVISQGGDEYAVKSKKQIHILGSKKDIEGFKNFVDNRPAASANKFELDIKNLNLTPEVVNYLYQDSRAKYQGRDIESYKREISKLINNLQSDFTNSEILETIKCI